MCSVRHAHIFGHARSWDCGQVLVETNIPMPLGTWWKVGELGVEQPLSCHSGW